MQHGSLFSGIGGFDLAAKWMGWINIFNCEIDPFCRKILKHHFPNSYQHEDIRTTDFTIWRGQLDLVTGGFPCQPYSTAGKRKGKEDDRHLWPQMLRAIREISPRWILGENVRGLTNWNGGLVFNEVQADLEAEGYEVLPFLLPAASVNAPHRRDRIFFVAYSNGIAGALPIQQRGQRQACDINLSWEDESRIIANSNIIDGGIGAGGEDRSKINNGDTQIITDAGGVGLEGRVYAGNSGEKGNGINAGCSFAGRNSKIDWQDFPTQSPVCNRNDGLSSGLADIAFPRWRRESIKALGNAIVPQVAYQIFKAIEKHEQL
jgi:DNA (cytosine-5)-methyltransferase 1